MIPDGAIVTYVGTWNPSWASADDTVSQVLAKLQTSGFASRSRPTIDDGFLQQFATTFGAPFTVTLQLEIENGLGYANNDDLISVIAHWVYVVTGNFPVSSSLPTVQLPKNVDPSLAAPGTIVTTGQPGATAPKTKGCISGGSLDTAGAWSLSCWWSNLTTKGLSTIGLLGIALMVGVALFFFYGPQRVRLET